MKKKLFPILFLCFVFIFSAYFVKPVFSQQAESKVFTGIIKDDSVNIRSGPGVNFEILRKMDKNDLVLVQDSTLDWYKIKLPRNSKAYISKDFLRMDGTSLGYSNADRVNVRAGKGTNFNVIGQLSKNDLVEVIEVDNEWAQIFSDNNCFAWVHKEFLNFNGPDTIYIAQENKNQEAWKLLQQAKMFEQSEGGITESNDKRAACIQKYNAIIRDYPQTSAANSAKKYISMLSMKQPVAKAVVQPVAVPEPPKTLTTESVKTPNKSDQQAPKKVLIKPASNPIAQGKLIESGRFFFRPGTHKLMENNQEKYFLKSEDIDLNTYIYHTVQIWGKIVSSDKTKIPIIEVEYVNQIN
ncbi:MAG: SH3 domain-containing protein [Candidatus Omnitrophica bacterium]|nr:SH3 domain-containing protein [Candidatus Omnitrophota bacterium]